MKYPTDENRSQFDQIYAALSFIPADDRDTWVRTGMAIKAELGDAGFGLWDDWSRNSDKHDKKAAKAVWRSFSGGAISIGSLFHFARQYGYTPDRPAPERRLYQRKLPPAPQCNTGLYAKKLWLRANCSDSVVARHPYAIKKGIDWSAGAGRTAVSGRVVGKNADCIVIPIRSIATNNIVAVQAINADGNKQSFGPVSGNGIIIGNTLDKTSRWFVVEGWADAISMVFHHYQGDAVAFAACGKSLMTPLAKSIANVYAPDAINIFEDARP